MWPHDKSLTFRRQSSEYIAERFTDKHRLHLLNFEFRFRRFIPFEILSRSHSHVGNRNVINEFRHSVICHSKWHFARFQSVLSCCSCCYCCAYKVHSLPRHLNLAMNKIVSKRHKNVQLSRLHVETMTMNGMKIAYAHKQCTPIELFGSFFIVECQCGQIFCMVVCASVCACMCVGQKSLANTETYCK